MKLHDLEFFEKSENRDATKCNTNSWHIAKLDRVRKSTVRKTC
jgi:hypothetical protein